MRRLLFFALVAACGDPPPEHGNLEDEAIPDPVGETGPATEGRIGTPGWGATVPTNPDGVGPARTVRGIVASNGASQIVIEEGGPGTTAYRTLQVGPRTEVRAGERTIAPYALLPGSEVRATYVPGEDMHLLLSIEADGGKWDWTDGYDELAGHGPDGYGELGEGREKD